MPNRIIKESICTSDSVDSLNWFEEVLFYRLIVSCDDFGRYDGRPAIIKNRLFPLKELLTIQDVANALSSLENAHLIEMYDHDGRPYLFLPTWENHQSIRAKKSKYPSPDDSESKHLNTSEIICKQMNANVPVIQSNTKSNTKSNSLVDNDNKRFSIPSLEEVEEYCNERNNNVDAQKFIDYYTANGWKVGRNPMKDWRAAVRTWEKNNNDNKRDSGTTPKSTNKWNLKYAN